MDFVGETVDLAWLQAWLIGRSLSRGLPMPIADRGGWRVDSYSGSERRRWVFAGLTSALSELLREPLGPGDRVRAIAPSEAFDAILPPQWQQTAFSHAMSGPGAPYAEPWVPEGYRLELRLEGAAAHAFIFDDAGGLAASGHAGGGPEAFVYDRIVTQENHQRRGLGAAVMAALASAKPDPGLPDILVATDAGRALYERLGWTVRAPYASASWIAD